MKQIILLVGIIILIVSGCEPQETIHNRGEPCNVSYNKLLCNISSECTFYDINLSEYCKDDECNERYNKRYQYCKDEYECNKKYEEEMNIIEIKGYCKDGYRIGGVW